VLPYDKIAKRYEDLYGAEQLRKNMIAGMFLDGAKNVLDVGCGTGMLGSLLRATEYYICLDLSRGMLNVFKRKNLTVLGDAVRADAGNLPFRDRSFDGVACITVLHEAINAMMEIARVIKPGGKIAVSIRKVFDSKVDLTGMRIEKVIESGGDDIFLLKAQ